MSERDTIRGVKFEHCILCLYIHNGRILARACTNPPFQLQRWRPFTW